MPREREPLGSVPDRVRRRPAPPTPTVPAPALPPSPAVSGDEEEAARARQQREDAMRYARMQASPAMLDMVEEARRMDEAPGAPSDPEARDGTGQAMSGPRSTPPGWPPTQPPVREEAPTRPAQEPMAREGGTETLPPCPFCEGEAILGRFNPHVAHWCVRCTFCGFHGHRTVDRHVAVAMWMVLHDLIVATREIPDPGNPAPPDAADAYVVTEANRVRRGLQRGRDRAEWRELRLRWQRAAGWSVAVVLGLLLAYLFAAMRVGMVP